MEVFAGVTAMETSAAAVTVRLAEPLTVPEVAVTVVEPVATPVATPLVETAAMPVGEVVHVTVLERFCVVLSEKVPVAVNCCVVPLAMELVAGVTAIDTSVATVPVPVSETDCGLSTALSIKVTAPGRVPVVVGVNVTETVQEAPTPSEPVQLLVWAKSPEATMLDSVVEAVPLFETVMVLAALVVPTVWLVKVRLEGEKEIPGTPVPVPVKLTDCGVVAALSVMVMVPVRVFTAVGVKVTEMVQNPPAPMALVVQF